jgi:hypothetical protein
MPVAVVPNVRRLAQYRPFERGGLDLRAVLADLVRAVAAIGDGAVESLFECRASFADLWGLEVEIDELRVVVDQLAAEGDVEKVGRGFRLSSELMGSLEATARAWDEIESRSFREWELAVRQVSPGITEEDMETLRADLRQWLHLVIAHHGAEAALILYPEDGRARRFFDDVDLRGFNSLPDRGKELAALRAEALPLFIRCPTPDQRRFLAGLLNTSFYMTVLTIDPGAGQLVRAQMQGHRIYLDTNFLYAVLGAAPADEVYSSRRLVQLTKELGFEFAVTPWTMAELRTSIARSRRDIEQQSRFVRPELASTMLRASGDKGFNRLFWQIYRDNKTQPKDVFSRLEHFDQELASYGITEVNEGCSAIERQDERIGLYASLVGAERWPFQKEPIVLEHDAKCRLLVERLRGHGHITLSNARFWFLTYDTKLPRFALRVPDNGDAPPELPFCMSPSAWVQIIRALTPRTDDFDRTVVDLLTSPFVGYRRAVDPAVLDEVVGRMDHFDDASPEMALAVLTDTARVTELEQAVSNEDDDAIEEAVRAAYSAKAQELQEAVAASARRVADIEKALADAEARAAEVEVARARDLQEAEEVRGSHREEADAAKTQLARQREEWEAEKQALQGELNQLESERSRGAEEAEFAAQRLRTMESRLDAADTRERRNRRLAGGFFLIALGLAVTLVLPLVVFSGTWAIGGAVVAGTALVLVGARVVAGKQWGGELALWLGVLAAIAAIVVAIIAASK